MGAHGTWQTTSSSGKGLLVVGVVAVAAAAIAAGSGAATARVTAAVTELFVWLAVILGVVMIAAVAGSVLLLRHRKAQDAIVAAQRETLRLEHVAAQETRRLERAREAAERDALAFERSLVLAAAQPAPVVNITNQIDPALALAAALLSGAQPQPVKVIPMQLERNQP